MFLFAFSFSVSYDCLFNKVFPTSPSLMLLQGFFGVLTLHSASRLYKPSLTTAYYCLLLSTIAYSYLLLPTTSENCLPLPTTAYYCLLLPNTAYYCLILPPTAYNCILLPTSSSPGQHNRNMKSIAFWDRVHCTEASSVFVSEWFTFTNTVFYTSHRLCLPL